MIKDITWINYGISEISAEKFRKVTNTNEVGRYIPGKPVGGLWASPVDSEWGWKDFCECENFRTETLDKSVKFKLKENSKIYTINSFNDLEKLYQKYPNHKLEHIENVRLINFEGMIADGYDGIYLTLPGLLDCKDKDGLGLMYFIEGWDVESVVVFNFESMIPEEK